MIFDILKDTMVTENWQKLETAAKRAVPVLFPLSKYVEEMLDLQASDIANNISKK